MIILFFYYFPPTVTVFRSLIFPIIANYKAYRNGGRQQVEDNKDWGGTNLIETRVVHSNDYNNTFLIVGGKQPEKEKCSFMFIFLPSIR